MRVAESQHKKIWGMARRPPHTPSATLSASRRHGAYRLLVLRIPHGFCPCFAGWAWLCIARLGWPGQRRRGQPCTACHGWFCASRRVGFPVAPWSRPCIARGGWLGRRRGIGPGLAHRAWLGASCRCRLVFFGVLRRPLGQRSIQWFRLFIDVIILTRSRVRLHRLEIDTVVGKELHQREGIAVILILCFFIHSVQSPSMLFHTSLLWLL